MEKEQEQWEIDLRAKLEAELKDGLYDLSSPGFVCWGGKGAYINFEVALRKHANKFLEEDENNK